MKRLLSGWTKDETKRILAEYGVKTVLGQNRKMMKSSQGETIVFDWALPAIKTCPNADACKKGCYGLQGAFLWASTINALENRLSLSKDRHFPEVMNDCVKMKHKYCQKKGKNCVIRIHSDGDYYSAAYLQDWLRVIHSNPDVMFYAYTKMVKLFKNTILPNNFTSIYSYGGKEDYLIDPKRDRHAKVFPDALTLLKSGYINASNNDMLALTDHHYVGLVYHGVKNYTNTNWNKVS